MNLRATPLFRLLLPFVAGILLAEWLDRPLPLWGWVLFGLAACILPGLARRRFSYRFRWVFGLLLFLFLVAAGYARTFLQDDRRQDGHFSRLPGEASWWVGRVYELPALGTRLRLPLRIEAAGRTGDSLQPCTGNLLLSLEIDSMSRALRYGDRLLVRSQGRPLEPPKNPHAFDYRRYLHYQNIHFQAFVSPDSLWRLSSGHGHPIWRVAYHYRERLLALLHRHFTEPDEYAVAAALLVGYKDELSEELQQSYAETGSMHALAVSGTHVGILYAGLLFLFQRLRVRGRQGHWVQTGLILVAIWAFTLLTGATASVLRASVMFSFYLCGKMLYRSASAWNILAGSALALLVVKPYFLFDAGFQLSYGAVAGMVFFYPRFYKYAPLLSRWPNEAMKVLLIGMAAQLGTLPLSLYYFHQFPVYFWLAGWVVVLGGALFLWAGSALVLLDTLWPVAADWLGVLLHYMIWGMNRIIIFIQGLPGSVITGIWVPAWAAAMLYASIICAAVAWVEREARWVLIALSIVAFLSLGRGVRAFQQSEQRAVIVYHVNKARLIDFMYGDTVFTWGDTLSTRQLKFTAQANRWAHGIRRELAVTAGFPAITTESNASLHVPILQFLDRRLAIIADTLSLAGPWRQEVDVLILSRNAAVRPDSCLARFPCRLVVFDATNKPALVRRWKAVCRSAGIPWYDVRERGAWVWEL